MNSFVTRLVALDRMIEITTLLLPSCLLLRRCRHHPKSAPPQPNRPHHQKSRSWDKEIGRCHEECTISKPFSRDKYIRHTLSVDKSNSEKRVHSSLKGTCMFQPITKQPVNFFCSLYCNIALCHIQVLFPSCRKEAMG